MDTPGALLDKNDIVSPCEVNRIAIGSDGKTFYIVDIAHPDNINGSKALYKSMDSGKSWSDIIGQHIYRSMTPAEQANFHVWNKAVAPDDVNFVAVVTNDSAVNLPRDIWISKNGGTEWQDTNCPAASNISAIDSSVSYGDRDIAIGTRTGTGGGTIWILKAPEYTNWVNQDFSGDILSLKFSPNYHSDATIAIVYTDTNGTYLNLGIRDLYENTTDWTLVYGGSPPEVTGTPGASPNANQIISADLELPGDFSGQALSLRRYYVSMDDAGVTGNGGIYRIDDTVAYQLMSATTTKRISGIAYYGNYASGKLLAGEVLGDPCSATVMTWFTDSPTTCPIPCWYPAMKPLTGAAGTDNCTGSGYGNTQVVWSPDGSVAYAGTASSATLVTDADWPLPYLTGEAIDESALSITRNNGETWNQLALIDTRISRLVDIAPAPDCHTIYLASVSDNVECSGFDSVWRSQSSPIGIVWERVLCQSTASQHCPQNQTDNAILRLAGDKTDGQIVFWAAVGTQKVMWSPDFGDYWTSTISPRLSVQDMAAEDSSTLYILSADGLVQKFTFSGTGWVSHAAVPTELDTGYSIATAYSGLTPDNDKGHIVVGGTGTGIYDVAYSTDGGTTFTPITTQLPTRGNTLVVAHSGYKSNGEIFAINTGGMYEWSVYYGGGTWAWPLPEFGEWAQQGWGSHTGLAISRNGSFYFSAPSWLTWTIVPFIRWSEATADLDLTINLGTDPTTRLRICGGLESGEPITVWIIDQRPYDPPRGGVWAYIDDLAWNGPTPGSPISNATVKYDPVSGRASEINLIWQPSSLSKGYRIQIAKDEDFALKITDIGGTWGGPFYTPPDLDAPSLVIPPGGGVVHDGDGKTWTVPALEAEHSYYWRVMVQNVATGDAIQSPWSWREIFTVKAGLPAATVYYGLQLLSPKNGCIGYPIRPISFAWSSFGDTTKCKFIMARDSAFKDVVVETEVAASAFTYDGTLDYGTNYFWQVAAVEPVPSNWSATFVFRTQDAPSLSSRATQKAPLWGWIIVIIGVALDVTLLLFILRR
jgi:hypothetical protein